MELSNSNIKKFLKFSYISGNENPKKLLIFWKMEIFIPSSKKEKKFIPPPKFLMYQEIELSNSNIKKILIFLEMEPRTFQPKFEK